MFPFWGNACYGSEPISHKASLERKLRFLIWMRDDLESINASIDTIRQQIERSDSAA